MDERLKAYDEKMRKTVEYLASDYAYGRTNPCREGKPPRVG